MNIPIDVLVRETLTKTRLKIAGHMDFCPICNRGIEPLFISAHFIENSRFGSVQIIYQCPIKDCYNIFIGGFEQRSNMFMAEEAYTLKSSSPKKFIEETFSTEINEISPLFGAIYNQSKNAEDFGLNEIAGGGYRKALEFLIKDYLISGVGINEDEVKNKMLGPCIEKYVENGNIKTCAKRAAWLGNDEIHYYRKWEDKDIDDLKKLIKLTALWIDGEITTNNFERDMPE